MKKQLNTLTKALAIVLTGVLFYSSTVLAEHSPTICHSLNPRDANSIAFSPDGGGHLTNIASVPKKIVCPIEGFSDVYGDDGFVGINYFPGVPPLSSTLTVTCSLYTHHYFGGLQEVKTRSGEFGDGGDIRIGNITKDPVTNYSLVCNLPPHSGITAFRTFL